MYDFNEDGVICRKDIGCVVQAVCGQREWPQGYLDKIIDNFFKEADINEDAELAYPEFASVIEKTPDFLNTFHYRI